MTTPINSALLGGDRHYTWPPTGEVFSSVTTNLGALAKPFLVPWAAKLSAEYAVKHWNELDALIKGGDPETAKNLIKVAHKKYRDVAAGVGTIAHDCLDQISWLRQGGVDYNPGAIAQEALLKFGEDNKEAVASIKLSDLMPYIESFEQWCRDFKPRFILSESTVYSRTYGYAGTFDFIAEVTLPGFIYKWMVESPELAEEIDDNDFYRVVVLGDYKTGNSIYPETGLQLSAYRYGDFIGQQVDGQWVEAPIPQVQGGLICHVRPKKTKASPVKCDLDVFDYFLSLTQAHRWRSQVSKTVLAKPLDPPPVLWGQE